MRILNMLLIAAFLIMPVSIMGAESGLSSRRCRLWVDVYRGEPLGYAEMLQDIHQSDIVYIGEIHTLKRHHETQERILDDICTGGVAVTLCLEQMESFNQGELDRYSRGEISFDDLALRTKWRERWNNYDDYRTIMETARRHGAGIIALNARQELVRMVARSGLGALSPADRSQLPALTGPGEPLYEKKIKRLLGTHAFAHPGNLQFMFEAQLVRDEAMAENVVRALSPVSDKKRLVVVIGGASHFSYGLGVPSGVRRRIPGVRDRILLLSESGDLSLSAHERGMAREIPHAHEDLRFLVLPAADYLEILEPEQK